MKVILRMLFLTFSNTNIPFTEKKLIWRFYTFAKTLSTIYQIELINKKEFIKVSLDKNIKVFVVYINSLSLRSKIIIHLSRKAQIALLLAKKVII